MQARLVIEALITPVSGENPSIWLRPLARSDQIHTFRTTRRPVRTPSPDGELRQIDADDTTR
ncbi:hypothetical protein GCM10009839_55610 [Catenulispora yoronensis]|uniref:Uncharacterized protein n=1 Tax=Catenulispora yoronensis TaxID=450799 RepID=A0ABP5GHK1_9ACTN